MRRVGIFGGTFDPPHIGHLVVVDQVLHDLEIDEVRLVVANNPWQKDGSRSISPAERRLEMVSVLAVDCDNCVPSAVEIEIGGPSYTSVTLEVLSQREPDVEWLPIVGSDVACGLDSWHQAEELAARYQFVVVNRPGNTLAVSPGFDVLPLEIPSVDISSSELRAMAGMGRSIRHLTSPGVIQLIDRWGLYGRGG